jgi:hypothetical protein
LEQGAESGVRLESRFGARGVLMPCAAVLTYDCHPDRGRRPADEGSALVQAWAKDQMWRRAAFALFASRCLLPRSAASSLLLLGTKGAARVKRRER